MAHLMTDKSNAITSRLIALDRAECLERLGYGSYVGRIGFIHDGRPMVLPVNYLLEGETIIFRTTAGTMVSSLDGSEVAFEVDSDLPLEHSGWSVLAHGRVERLQDDADVERLRRGALRSWAWHAADEFLLIVITDISGRKIPES